MFPWFYYTLIAKCAAAVKLKLCAVQSEMCSKSSSITLHLIIICLVSLGGTVLSPALQIQHYNITVGAHVTKS